LRSLRPRGRAIGRDALRAGTTDARSDRVLRKILCPIDFSRESQRALRVAARLAATRDAELVVAYVWHLPALAVATEEPSPVAEMQQVMEADRRALQAAVDEAVALGARASSRFLSGTPWLRIVDTAEQDPEFDLIVMGSRGRTGVGRFVLGSVAERVVRHAPTSVLVARTEEKVPFRHVLCAIDSCEDSAKVVERAVDLADSDGLGLLLFHAIDMPLRIPRDPSLTEFLVDLDRRAIDELDHYAKQAQPRIKARIRTTTESGDPAREILHCLESDSFDLLVVGSHGRTGIRRALLGSVAEKLVRHAPCSVLVTRAKTAKP
jgi:nucleotide-binding universal stress UspA family protein